MVTATDKSAKQSRFVYQFSWLADGLLVYARYTDWTSDVFYGGATYLAVPSIEVNILPANTGTLEEAAAQIIVPQDAFFSRLSNGEPQPITTLEIAEILADSGGAVDARTHFRGEVRRLVRNFEGRPESLLIEAVSEKGSLDYTGGYSATEFCDHVFTGKGCEVSAVGLAKIGTVVNVAGFVATMVGLPTHTGRYWHRGYLERAGVRIGVRDWSDAAPQTFVLFRPAPPSWLNTPVIAFPGCDKLRETCAGTWSNEQHFLGFGIAMLKYNAVLESP